MRDWAEKRRKPVVSCTVCSPTFRVDSPTSDMSVCLRGRKSHAGALKSDFVGKNFFNFEKRENVSEETITRNAQSSFRWILKGDTQGAWAQFPSSGW